jgi:hypothetical protein
MKIFGISTFLVLTTILNSNSFAYNECNCEDSKGAEKANVMQLITSQKTVDNPSGGKLSDHRICSYKIQAEGNALAIRYVLEPINTKTEGSQCSEDDSVFHPGQFTSYLVFTSEFEAKLFYMMLKRETGITISSNSIYNDTLNSDEIIVYQNGKKYAGVSLDRKLSAQWAVQYPNIAEKMNKAVEARHIKPSEVDRNLTDADEIVSYVSTNSKDNECLRNYLDILEKPGFADVLSIKEYYFRSKEFYKYAYLYFLSLGDGQ